MTYLNTAMLLEHAAQSSPDQAFILTGTEGFTYNRVDQEANRVANALTGLGIRPGDRIALQLPNVGRMPIILFGCFKLGAVPVMLNVTAPGPEIASLLAASNSVAMICSEACVQAALDGFRQVETCQHILVGDAGRRSSCPAPTLNLSALCSEAATRFDTFPVKADQPAAMLYTSGTTGLPKGIVHSHLSYYYTAVFSAREFWRLEPNDVMLMVAPGSSIFGQAMLTSACAAGATVSLLPRFNPEDFLMTIQNHRVTFFAGVPTLVHFMLNSPVVEKFDLSSLRKVMISGAPLSSELAGQFIERFGADMITGYGMTEGVPITYLNADMYRRAPAGAVGLPAMGVSVRIVDETGQDQPVGEAGEIVFRGPQLCSGYYENPDQWDLAWRDNWFHTGDLGRLDQNGYLYLLERMKDLIKRSGHSVFPSEVEQALYKHPAVAEAAVFGIAHDALGEEIKAAVVLKPGMTVEAQTLIDHCKSLLAAYKYPRMISFHDHLPKNHNGKILRWALRDGVN